MAGEKSPVLDDTAGDFSISWANAAHTCLNFGTGKSALCLAFELGIFLG